ncbi:hypothetical protein NDU88_002639 [Pleurodeles waltl]|uniref:Uncharacterized protein n=1 Tax=Pleurodeles waltl TaxID=8319 RepID=A0AAV7W099_PLEWA|nr:hypothetical protein NDU88_002639 [Pleurodeles waltl]
MPASLRLVPSLFLLRCLAADQGYTCRLSGNPAHDASEWRLLRGVRGKEDGLPCCLGNRDAGTSRRNPDIRVPEKPEKEDGLPQMGHTEDEEDAEETGREEDGERTEDEARKTNNDGSRIGNHAVPKKATSSGEAKRAKIREQTATPQEGRG